MMIDKKILLDSKQISENYNVKSITIDNARRKGQIKGNLIGRKYLYELSEVERWLGIKPSNDEVVNLKLENERLKAQINGYKKQYKQIKDLLQVLTGAINAI
ncbi:MAG: DNA-binding protein [Clostridiales bacterium]|nr:DNA-binding protein [Clostridiales bacterium]